IGAGDEALTVQRRLGHHDAGRSERSEEHTSELQSLAYLVCRLLLEKKQKHAVIIQYADRDKPHTGCCRLALTRAVCLRPSLVMSCVVCCHVSVVIFFFLWTRPPPNSPLSPPQPFSQP